MRASTRVAVCAVALLLAVWPAAAAAEEPGSYRYWAFWQQNGGNANSENGEKWSYATKGPSVLRPADGAVLGFRFALSEDSDDAAKPRGDVEFDAACESTEAKKDRKRVAIRIDFGTAAHATGGARPPKARTACAQVAEDASAAEALAAVTQRLRYNSDALLCAIDGYPKQGCGEAISGDKASGDGGGDQGSGEQADGDQADGGLGPVAGIAAGAAAVAVLAAAAARQTRRRR
jgi:hypothetical protein